jgi:hypothetical protein
VMMESPLRVSSKRSRSSSGFRRCPATRTLKRKEKPLRMRSEPCGDYRSKS